MDQRVKFLRDYQGAETNNTFFKAGDVWDFGGVPARLVKEGVVKPTDEPLVYAGVPFVGVSTVTEVTPQPAKGKPADDPIMHTARAGEQA